VSKLEDLADQIRRELHFRTVTQRLSKGSQPELVRVTFEAVKREFGFDLSVPRFLYHSRQGFSGEANARLHGGSHSLTLAAVSNGDDLTERFSGIAARYRDSHVGSDKLALGLTFEDFHEQWQNATRNALPDRLQPEAGLQLYRSRRNVAPEISVAPVKSLTVSAGLSFESMQPEYAGQSPASANAVTGEIHYGRKIEGGVYPELQQSIDARYRFRAGLRGLGSDFGYTRQTVSARYEVKSGRLAASDEFTAGVISGDAPMFERFVLGSSTTLRGWDRYLIDPVGGTREVHNSLSWSYQFGVRNVEAFYDTGTLGHPGRPGPLRHALGASYRQGVFVITMAFPLIEGRVTPVFMAGMNY
jgi:hypothetical protein